MSAKVITIAPRYVLCDLQEVRVLRSVTPGESENKTAISGQQTASEKDKNHSDNKFRISDIGVDLTESVLSED